MEVYILLTCELTACWSECSREWCISYICVIIKTLIRNMKDEGSTQIMNVLLTPSNDSNLALKMPIFLSIKHWSTWIFTHERKICRISRHWNSLIPSKYTAITDKWKKLHELPKVHCTTPFCSPIYHWIRGGWYVSVVLASWLAGQRFSTGMDCRSPDDWLLVTLVRACVTLATVA